MIPIGLAINNYLPGMMSQVMSTAGVYITSLLPTVSAASDETWYNLSKNMECPALSYYGIVGDALDIATAVENEANLKWNSGAACVADDSNLDWEQNKYYQRYIEDKTYMESEGIIEKSSITAF